MIVLAVLLGYACNDVSVTAVVPARVDIEPASSFVRVGESSRLTASVRSSEGELLTGYSIQWTSLNPLVAEVDGEGNVTGLRAGNATIRATADGAAGTASVTVTSGPAVQVTTDTVDFVGITGGANPGDRAVSVVNAGDGALSGLSASVHYPAGQPGGWLQAELSGGTAPATLVLRAAQGALAVGAYRAVVRVASPLASNDADSVVVRFTVLSPLPAIALGANSVTFETAQNGGDPATQNVAISNAGGGTLSGLGASITYTAGQPTGWLTAQLAGTTAPTTLALRPVTAGLAPGSYSATVSVTSGVAQNSPQTITVTFNVAQPLPVLSVDPTTLTFAAPQGGANPAAQAVQLTNAGGGTVSGLGVAVSYPGGQPSGWLSVNLSQTTAPAEVTVTAATGALLPGTYSATLNITSSTASNSPQQVAVTFQVQSPLAPSAPTGLTATTVSSSRIDLAWNAATGIVTRYRIERATGAGSFAAIDSVAAAVRAYQDGGRTPATQYRYRVQACNASACSAYSAEASATTAPLPAIGLGATSATFAALQNGGNPSAQTIGVTNSGGETLTGLGASISYGSGQPTGWLSAQLTGTTAPANLTLQATTGSLAEGSYTATVSITSPVATNSPRTITVTFNVGPALPLLNLAPTSLNFAGPQGAANPAAQQVQITNAGGGTVSGLAVSTTYPGGQPSGWLTPSLGGSTAAPATLTVSVSTAGLGEGTYTATLSIASSTAANSPQLVAVTLQVQPPLPPSAPTGLTATAISSSRIDLAWSGAAGVVNRFLIERATGAGSFAQIDSVGAAIRAYADQGLAPATEYRYRIRACNSNACSAYSSVATATTIALPAIGLSASSRTFSAQENGANPAAQNITVSNTGGGTLTGLGITADFGAGPSGWLSLNLSSTTAPSTLSIQPLTGSLAPGSYTATVNVTSGVASNSPQPVTVTFNVTAAPLLSLDPTALVFATPQGGSNPANQQVTITNGGGGTLSGLDFDVTYGVGQPTGWLSPAPSLSSTTAPATLTVSAAASGLAEGTYTATLAITSTTAENSPQNVTVTFQVQPPLAPSAPAGLSATAVSASRIDLAWSGSTGVVDRYRIERATGAGAFAVIDSVAAGVLAYQDEGLAAATEYRYRVQACNSNACSGYSSVATDTTDALPAIGLSADSVEFAAEENGANPASQDITISNTGDGALTGLVAGVSYAGGQPTGWLDAQLSGTSVPATLTLQATTSGLAPGTYSATVSITSGVASNSPQTVQVTFEVQAPPAPSTPAGLSATAVTSSRIDLAWSGSAGVVARYRIERAAGAGEFAVLDSVDTGTLAFQDEGLAAATEYRYRVQACNSGGCSGYSNEANATTDPPPAIGLSADSVGFAAEENGAIPESQAIIISNIGGDTLTGLGILVTYAEGQPTDWLGALLSDTSAPATLTLQPTTTGLAPGTYSATVQIDSGVASNGPLEVQVTFEVQAPPA